MAATMLPHHCEGSADTYLLLFWECANLKVGLQIYHVQTSSLLRQSA